MELIPTPPPPPRSRGRPVIYSDGLLLKALVIMIVRRIHRVLRASCGARRTHPRDARLARTAHRERSLPEEAYLREEVALPARDTLPARIGVLGRHLVTLLQPWARTGRAVALDSTVLFAKERRGVAQEGQGSRHSAPFLNRYPGRMDQVRLARVSLRLEAAPGHHRKRRVDTARCSPHPGQRLRQPGGPLALIEELPQERHALC